VQEVTVRFDRGTLVVDGSVEGVPDLLWDARTQTWRAAAHRLPELRKEIAARGGRLVDLGMRWSIKQRDTSSLDLRDYQRQALAAWTGFERRGVIVLPTGAGKTRVAIAAVMESGLPTVVLCPTRALAATWVCELERWLDEPIGLVGDGERRVERVTVMTFESAYRHMDSFGDRFGLLIVDEVHHFTSGARIEALEASPSIARLGLTATLEPTATAPIEQIVGRVVFEMNFSDLVGKHLAPVRIQRMAVRLEPDERTRYDADVRPFRDFVRGFFAAYPGADYESMNRALQRSPQGRDIMKARAKAEELAAFPRVKRRLVTNLLDLHRADKTLVFTAFVENAYELARQNFLPVITGETSLMERRETLARFAVGRYRTLVSARVLNEGIDVPDARIAIIVAGTLGPREHVQRIGRVVRPAEGKHAVVYELITADTSDERRARQRGRHAPRSTH
jgi:superfamily II DNA or RNA helicase